MKVYFLNAPRLQMGMAILIYPLYQNRVYVNCLQNIKDSFQILIHGVNYSIITLGEIYLSILEMGHEGNLSELWNDSHVAGMVACWLAWVTSMDNIYQVKQNSKRLKLKEKTTGFGKRRQKFS